MYVCLRTGVDHTQAVLPPWPVQGTEEEEEGDTEERYSREEKREREREYKPLQVTNAPLFD